MKPSTFLMFFVFFIVIGLLAIFGLRININNDEDLRDLTRRYTLTVEEVRNLRDQILETPIGKEHTDLYSQAAEAKDEAEKQVLNSRLQAARDQISATSIGVEYQSRLDEANKILKERRQIFDAHVIRAILFISVAVLGIIFSTGVYIASSARKRGQPLS